MKKFTTKVNKNEIIFLRLKNDFTVKELQIILSSFDENTKISFGVLSNKATEFYQDDDFIFRVSSDGLNENGDSLEILTDYRRA